MTAPQKNTRPSALKRYGPLIGIVVVIAIVGIVIAVASGGGDDKKASSGGGDSSAAVKGLPLTYPQAKADGKASSIDWGPNCNTDLGQVKIPSIYSPSCVEPYDAAKGNGGATSPGVTADTINLVYYIADPKLDPLLASQVSGAGADIGPDATFKTAQGFAAIYQKTFELWGRKVNLVKFVGTGSEHRRGRGEGRRGADRLRLQAVRGDGRSVADVGVPRRAGVAQHHVPRRLRRRRAAGPERRHRQRPALLALRTVAANRPRC